MENLQENKKISDKIKSKIKGKLSKKVTIAIILISILIILLCSIFVFTLSKEKHSNSEIITTSNLKQIIEISELSAYECIYNGIVTVYNEKKPEKIDYHVSYEAKVKAGINFEEIVIDVNNEDKTITVKIPPVTIQTVTVDLPSLDFIFENKKAETSSVIADAYKMCEKDVREETNTNNAIYSLAEENAKNIITALLQPFVKQLDAEYTVTIA